MENASKALIMAGGVLIALLVIGALMLMFNNLSTYENANRQSEAESHIADFNKEFVGYERDNVTGIDLVSISNKIESYQTIKSDDEDYANMKVKIVGLTLFETSIKNGQQLLDSTSTVRKLESTYGISKIKKLISNKSNLQNGTKTLSEILGTDDSNISKNNYSIIDNLSDYSEYKTKKFKGEITNYTKDGKVQELTFTAK